MLNNAPAIRRKRHNGDLAAGHVLLILKREIARHENIVLAGLRCVQQVAILKAAKPGVHSGGHFMVWQLRPQLMGHVLVEQDSQGCSRGLWE